MTKFNSAYNAFNCPIDAITIPCGKKIYKWIYLDQDGNEVEAERNIYELINSYDNDYKKLIEGVDANGEFILSDTGARRGLYADTSNMVTPDGRYNIDYIASLIQNIQDAIAKEQSSKVTRATKKSGENQSKDAENNEESTNKTEVTES